MPRNSFNMGIFEQIYRLFGVIYFGQYCLRMISSSIYLHLHSARVSQQLLFIVYWICFKTKYCTALYIAQHKDVTASLIRLQSRCQMRNSSTKKHSEHRRLNLVQRISYPLFLMYVKRSAGDR